MLSVCAPASTTISRQALVDGLIERSRRGAFVATIETLTDPRLRKTGNPLAGLVRKRSLVNVVLNFRYESAVNRQQVREGADGSFEAQPRKWGERVAGTPLVEHNGRLYVEAKVQRSLGHQYEFADGSIVSDDEVRPFLPARQSSADAQGVEREVVVRDYAVESIVALTVDGERMKVASDVLCEA